MIVLVYVLAFVLMSSAAAAVWRRECGGRLILTPFFIFCINDVLRVWPAAIYMRCTGESQDVYAALVVLSSSLAFVVGYLVVRDVIGWRVGSPSKFFESPMLRTSPSAHLFAIVACALLFARLGYYFYEGAPPLLTGIGLFLREGYGGGVASFMAEQRLLFTKGHYFGEQYRGQGVIREVMRTGWPLLLSVSVLLFLQKRKPLWLFLSLLLLIPSFVYIAGDGTRRAFADVIVGLVVLLSLVVRMRFRTLCVFGAVLLAVLFGLSTIKKFSHFGREGTLLKSGAQRLVERITVGNGVYTVHVIEFVRSGQIELGHGRIHRTDAINALPCVHVGEPFDHELFQILNPYKDRTTFFNMTYLGRLYADFGWPGALVGFFLIGAFTALSTCYLFSWRKTVLNTVIISLLSLAVGNIALHGPIAVGAFLVVLAFIGGVYAFFLSLANLYLSMRNTAQVSWRPRIGLPTPGAA